MTEIELHGLLVKTEFLLALLTVLSLIFITAPYGRHIRKGWGPTINSKLSWVLMEIPAVLFVLGFYATGPNRLEVVPLILLSLWQLHYIHRTFVFPLRMRSSDKGMPILIVLLGFLFNTLNAWINAKWISAFGSYDLSWLQDPRFIFGVLIFLAGFCGNIYSDEILRNLRKPGESGYKIPRGGLYKWVSSPNYLCETVEWFGWALATWSTAGLAFAVYTAANLAPRAFVHHKWYREKFTDYPEKRRAFIPYVW